MAGEINEPAEMSPISQKRIVEHPMRRMNYLTTRALTHHHRLVDGRDAVLFLRRVKEAAENPASVLVEN